MVEYKDRLAAAMKAAGISASELAGRLSTSYQAVKKVLDGKSSAFTAPNNAIAAECLGVSSDWLALGAGPKERGAVTTVVQKWPFTRVAADDLSALNKEQIASVEGAISLAVAQMRIGLPVARPVIVEQHDDNLPSGLDFVPIQKVEFRISAGVAGFSVSQERDAFGGVLYFSKAWLEKRRLDAEKLFITFVRGMSMYSTLSEGDAVVVNTGDTTRRQNEVFAINHDGEFVVKRLTKCDSHWWLESDNTDKKKYPPVMCTASTFIIGRIVHKQSDSI